MAHEKDPTKIHVRLYLLNFVNKLFVFQETLRDERIGRRQQRV